MRMMQARTRLDDDAGGDAQLSDAIWIARPRDEIACRHAIEIWHHEEVLGAVAAQLVHLTHVWMIEARDELALLEKHRDECPRCDQLGQQALDHDRLLEASLAGEAREVDLG